MYIAIANSIGSSSNSGGPVSTTERYEIQSCTYDTNQITQDYPIGTYQVNDRVVYYSDANGEQYGRILKKTSSPITNNTYITNFYGIHNVNCYDNRVNLDAYVSTEGADLYFIVELTPLDQNFVSVLKTDNQYDFSYNWYVEIYYEYVIYGDTYNATYSGGNSVSLNSGYEFYQNSTTEIYNNLEFASDGFITYAEISYMTGTASLSTASAFKTNADCSNNISMRNSGQQLGTTVYFGYRNDDC